MRDIDIFLMFPYPTDKFICVLSFFSRNQLRATGGSQPHQCNTPDGGVAQPHHYSSPDGGVALTMNDSTVYL